MAAGDEAMAVRLARFIALGVPMLSRVLAGALVIAALAVAFLELGGYDAGTRADVAMLLAGLALLMLALGRALPWLLLRFLPPRR
jgi:predicted amidohydrolase